MTGMESRALNSLGESFKQRTGNGTRSLSFLVVEILGVGFPGECKGYPLTIDGNTGRN